MKQALVLVATLLWMPAASYTQELKRNYYESYLGVGTGQANLRGFCKAVGAVAGFSGTCDDSNTGVKVFGGYKFNRLGGVELGYTSFGEGRADGTLSGTPVISRWKGYGIDLSAVGTLPLGDYFELFVKGGLTFWDVRSTTMTVASGEINDRGFSGLVGGGGTWWFMQQAGLRLQYERFQKVGDSSVQVQTNIDFASLNLVGRF